MRSLIFVIALKRFVGPMLLGLRYLNGILVAKAQSAAAAGGNEKQRSVFTAAAVRMAKAGPWVKDQVPKTVESFQSSFHLTVHVASVDYDDLFPEGEFNLFPKDKLKPKSDHLVQVTVPNVAERLDLCLRMWRLIRLYINDYPDPKVIKGPRAWQRINFLEEQIKAQLPPQGSGKKRLASSSPIESASPASGSLPYHSTPPQEVAARLTINQEQREQYYNPYEPTRSIVPLDGPTQSLAPLTVSNIQTLYHNGWLDDRVIDAYLSLVCHEGNELFGKEGLQRGSPKWHTWSVLWPAIETVSWPPPAYPEARVEDVEHHFFPRGERSHWTLFHLWRSGGNWTVHFYSSLPGYDDQQEEQWPIIAAGLMTRSPDFIPGAVMPSKPRPQPQQYNSNDCGVLVLCTARWIVEGWSLSTLRASDCPRLREWMIVELGKWRLHI